MKQTIDKGIFSQKQLALIQKLRKNFLRYGVYVLIGGVILGAALILVGGTDAGEYIAKTMGMFLVFALMMLISSNNFKVLESNRRSAQILALVGLAMNFLWGILWTLLIWQVFDMMTYKTCTYGYECANSYWYTDGLSVMGKITLIATYLSMLGFFGSNIMNLKEYDRKSAILPLKITAMVCLSYCVAYAIFMALSDFGGFNDDSARFAALSGFAGMVWIVTWIIAAVFSRGARKKSENTKNAGANSATVLQPEVVSQSEAAIRPETAIQPEAGLRSDSSSRSVAESEAEIRARIEEKVRREMELEREIRERLERENQDKDN